MPRITTVIFDMYGTLVQHPEGIEEASFAKSIKQQNLDTTAHELWKQWRPSEEQFRRTRVDPNRPFQSYFDAWKAGFERTFSFMNLGGDAHATTLQFFRDLSQRPPYPEASEAVAEMQKHFRTALLSNADDGFLLPNLEVLNVDFEIILSSEQAQIYKPRPELFQRILEQLGVSPEETIYVGDRQLEDVLGATQVGIHPVWINRDNRPVDSNLTIPTYQISGLLELPRLLHDELTQ